MKSITDKVAQNKPKKSAISKVLRERRKANPAHCDGCGFRVRGENHLDGDHHKNGARQDNV